jgi:effector-binding domain-containing protein
MSDGVISIKTVTPLPLAAMRRKVTSETLSPVTMGLPVWTRVQERALKSLDTSVIIYHDSCHRMLIHQPGGVEIDYGVLLSEPFEGDRVLHCVMTPGGRVAHSRHNGGYQMLPVIHTDIRAWCIDKGHQITGTHWEHHVVWNEDPDRCVTDIYYQLR